MSSGETYNTTYSSTPEIAATQAWIGDVIIGQGFCPPMAILAHQNKNPDGTPNWNKLSEHIDITSFTKFDPNSQNLLEKVTESYYRFMLHATNRGKPLSKIIILPDFYTNTDYDDFVLQMKYKALEKLTTNDGKKLVRSAITQRGALDGIPKPQVQQVLSSPNDFEIATAQTIEGIFNPAYFYGQPLSESDISDFADTRGPKSRQKVLSRAPYYLLQIVNSLASPELSGGLNKDRLYVRNSHIASNTNLAEFNAQIDSYRE